MWSYIVIPSAQQPTHYVSVKPPGGWKEAAFWIHLLDLVRVQMPLDFFFIDMTDSECAKLVRSAGLWISYIVAQFCPGTSSASTVREFSQETWDGSLEASAIVYRCYGSTQHLLHPWADASQGHQSCGCAIIVWKYPTYFNVYHWLTLHTICKHVDMYLIIHVPLFRHINVYIYV